MPIPKLFTPIKVGHCLLQHRVVLPPLTRLRADDNHVPIKELVVEHYAQRAAVPGTLLIAEGTLISAKAGGWPNIPGIWSDAQLAVWKEVVDAVHKRGSFIFIQLAAIGRMAAPAVLEMEGPYPLVSPTDSIPTGGSVAPTPLTIDGIKEYVKDFATAAYNAVHVAGFDGVELHGGSGFLIDQFIQDTVNTRTDEYGGSIENRSRFVLEVVDAVVEKVGAERTALRVGPWSHAQDMGMEDPVPTFSYIVQKLAEKHSSLGYIHVIEPRLDAAALTDRIPQANESNDFIRKIWQPRPLISAGGYNRELALEVAETKGDLIALGRYYTSNPDLPLRLKKDLPLTKYDRSTFYTAKQAAGYNTYAYATENEAELGKAA
ncbi:FMN-linked oxidoreductase [Irpex lacteus]|nr:FMN-linked oxidoreductase [Irpex lacteus]